MLTSLRMQESGKEEKFLGSRRAARALRSLNEPMVGREGGEGEQEERVLWSRRLAKMIRSWRNEEDSKNLQFATAIAEKPKQVQSAVMVKEKEEEGVKEEGNVRNSFRPNLPELSASDMRALRRGERVQKQMREGRIGTGLVVVDVEADLSTVFAVLTDIDRYPERIPTVREAITYEMGERTRKTQFQISRFRLQINTELKCVRDQNMLTFEMDKKRPAPFLEEARGFWYLEKEESEGEEPRTRIWLVADIACSQLLPTAIVDYAAARALPRATTWLQPVMKDMAEKMRYQKRDLESGWPQYHA